MFKVLRELSFHLRKLKKKRGRKEKLILAKDKIILREASESQEIVERLFKVNILDKVQKCAECTQSLKLTEYKHS